MRFRKILCPIDFSEGSQHALRVAVRLASKMDSELLVVHVWHVPSLLYSGDVAAISVQAIEAAQDDAQRGLADAVREATAAGATKVSSKLLEGIAWDRLVELLEDDRKVDLVVVG